MSVLSLGNDSIINGTMAIMVTDLDLFVTPFNVSMLNPHIIALGVSLFHFLANMALVLTLCQMYMAG